MMWCKRMRCGYSSGEKIVRERESLPIPSSSDYTYTSVDKREKESCCRACSIDGHLRHQFRWISLSICVRPTWTYRLDAIQQKSTDAGDTMLLMPVHWFIDTHAAAGAVHGCAHIISVSNVAIRAEEGWREKKKIRPANKRSGGQGFGRQIVCDLSPSSIHSI